MHVFKSLRAYIYKIMCIFAKKNKENDGTKG